MSKITQNVMFYPLSFILFSNCTPLEWVRAREREQQIGEEGEDYNRERAQILWSLSLWFLCLFMWFYDFQCLWLVKSLS